MVVYIITLQGSRGTIVKSLDFFVDVFNSLNKVGVYKTNDIHIYGWGL